jgi:hypothetical protein
MKKFDLLSTIDKTPEELLTPYKEEIIAGLETGKISLKKLIFQLDKQLNVKLSPYAVKQVLKTWNVSTRGGNA